MGEYLKQQVRELKRKQRELALLQKEVTVMQRSLKESLLAGAPVEPGTHHAELRLLPGRNPSSKNPDDYELVISYVS